MSAKVRERLAELRVGVHRRRRCLEGERDVGVDGLASGGEGVVLHRGSPVASSAPSAPSARCRGRRQSAEWPPPPMAPPSPARVTSGSGVRRPCAFVPAESPLAAPQGFGIGPSGFVFGVPVVGGSAAFRSCARSIGCCTSVYMRRQRRNLGHTRDVRHRPIVASHLFRHQRRIRRAFKRTLSERRRIRQRASRSCGFASIASPTGLTLDELQHSVSGFSFNNASNCD